jgi:MFS family permease
MLNLPIGLAAATGPILGGFVTESVLGWRGLFWGTIPLVVIAGSLVAVGISGRVQKVQQKIDILGTLVMALAATALIFGLSWLGVPGRLGAGVVLLVVSVAAWAGFIFIEEKAEAPILDPQVLFNRTFITAAGAALLSFFGLVGIMAYSPIFAQDVMEVSPTVSGSMLTPFTVMLALVGIPAGFLLAKTKKYKWMYNIGYAIVTLAMFAMWRFTADTPIWLYVLVTFMAGLGLGAVPTINTLVAQFAVPKRLLGVAVGAIFFFQMIGIAIAPPILGLAQNSAPDLESGLQRVFLVGAVTMLISFFLITTIPEVSIDVEVPDKAVRNSLGERP